MNVLVTVALLLAAAMWIAAISRRLSRMRDEIKVVWLRLESDQSNEALKTVYNRHVAKYNDALETFPGYLVAPLFGFKPARRFN